MMWRNFDADYIRCQLRLCMEVEGLWDLYLTFCLYV